jgi:hypothetical protein
MQSESYKDNLIETLKNLVQVNESIYRSVINISMQGELKEFNDAVPIGEEHELQWDLFKNSNDVNIQLLIKLMGQVEDVFQSICNLNNIELESK